MPSDREELRRRVEAWRHFVKHSDEPCPLCVQDDLGCGCVVDQRAIAELLLKIDKLEGRDAK